MADDKKIVDLATIIDNIIKQISDIAEQLKALAKKMEHEHRDVAAIRLQAAACGFLAQLLVRRAKQDVMFSGDCDVQR
jgi:hypothetical protein